MFSFNGLFLFRPWSGNELDSNWTEQNIKQLNSMVAELRDQDLQTIEGVLVYF